MSTLLYALRTEQREKAASGASIKAFDAAGAKPPASSPFLDGVAALVPAEVLGLHALAVSLWTTTREVPKRAEPGEDATNTVTTITDEADLKAAFWVLAGLAAFIYVFKKRKSLHWLDAVRLVIPAGAFVVWTALQQNSAFDAVWKNVSEDGRIWYGAIAAVVLGMIAVVLGYQADQSNPSG